MENRADIPHQRTGAREGDGSGAQRRKVARSEARAGGDAPLRRDRPGHRAAAAQRRTTRDGDRTARGSAAMDEQRALLDEGVAGASGAVENERARVAFREAISGKAGGDRQRVSARYVDDRLGSARQCEGLRPGYGVGRATGGIHRDVIDRDARGQSQRAGRAAEVGIVIRARGQPCAQRAGG